MTGVRDRKGIPVPPTNAAAQPPELVENWEELPTDRVGQLRGFGVWDSGDVETWVDLFSPDCEFRSLLTDRVEGPAAFEGHEGLRTFWNSQREIWEEMRHVSERAWRRGRFIIVAGHQQVRAKGSGAEVEMRVVFLSERDAEGKIRWAAQFASLEEAVDAAKRRAQPIEINGVAHIQLSVNRYAECVSFYDRLMPYLGLRAVHRSDEFTYYVGGRTGYLISPADPRHADDPHVPTRAGLHHYCLRARSREDIDDLYVFLKDLGARMVRAPEEGPWAPGYYSLSFLDPDGIRLEVNHVPGKGVFAEGAAFNPDVAHPVTGRPPDRIE